MNTILTCTDGSKYSSSVYDHTAWAANRMQAIVHVLHMLDSHRETADLADLSGNLGLDTGRELLRDLVSFEEAKNRLARERGKAIIEEAERRLRIAGLTNLRIEQQHGELVESVALMEHSADLVVIGKRGESAGFARDHLGSNLERVIRASVRPVLVVPQEFKPITKFLLAYDGGPSVEKAITFAKSNPLLQGLACHLVRAGRIDSQAEWFLAEAAAGLAAAGYDVTHEAIPGAPEEVLSAAMKRENAGLLVMGAYGHSRIRQLMVGSTTTAMVRTCQTPVLMFR